MLAFIVFAIQCVVMLTFHNTNATTSFGWIDLVYLTVFSIQVLAVFFRIFYFIMYSKEDLVEHKNYKLVRIVENIIIITGAFILLFNLFFLFLH